MLRRFYRWALSNCLPERLFDPGISLAEVRRLVKTYVELVEIENHSYCNRTCWFCPNAHLDRASESNRMSDALYHKILDDLASIEYDQTLVWARYHEPLSDESIYDRIALARQRLPRAYLKITTNGDYLNADRWKRLKEAGLDRIRINLYFLEGQAGDQEVVLGAVKNLVRRSGLSIEPRAGVHYYRINDGQLKGEVVANNYENSGLNMSSRGGLLALPVLQEYVRTSACFSPIKHLAIDYNGKAMLCCQVRSDAPEHQNAVICDLNQAEQSLFTFYRDLAPARLSLLQSGVKGGVCKTCTQNLGGPDHHGRNPYLAQFLNSIPGLESLLTYAMGRRHRVRRYEFTD